MVGARARVQRVFLVAVLVSAGLIAAVQSPAAADVSGMTGNAFGYHAAVGLFGGPLNVRGPAPTVTLPPSGGTRTATAATTLAQIGPAQFFSSSQVNVSTTGTPGPGGSVTSTATINNADRLGSESFGYGPLDTSTTHPKNPLGLTTNISSTCTASESGSTGSVAITNGQLELDNGYDANNNDSYNDPGDHPPVRIIVPADPLPNTTYEGHIEVNGSQDFFRFVFNEQVPRPDGGITVYAFHEYVIGPTAVGDLYVGKVTCSVAPHVVADFSRDGRTDPSVYRPTDQSWWAMNGSNGFWGTAADVPVPADYTGDGKVDFAVYRPSTGEWYVQGGTNAVWGTAGDIPVPADYTGDGKADIAVFRPSTGAWYVLGGSNGIWGLNGDVPVPADYDGDGKADFATFRPSNRGWYVANVDTAINPHSIWGLAGDVPVPGDYTGDGKADYAVYRPGDGSWWVRNGTNAFWGTTGDVPQPGDYDADGRTDFAVYRPSTGGWYIFGGTNVFWGTTGDKPLVLPWAIRSVYFP